MEREGGGLPKGIGCLQESEQFMMWKQTFVMMVWLFGVVWWWWWWWWWCDDGGGDAGGNGGEYDLSMQRVGGWTVMHARRKAT